MDQPASSGQTEIILPSKCPFCGSPNIRHWFVDTPRPLSWCLDCMCGEGSDGHGPIIDMHVFENAIEEKQQYDAAKKAEEERKEALRIPYFKAYIYDRQYRDQRSVEVARTPEDILERIQGHCPRFSERKIENLGKILLLLDSGDSLQTFSGVQRVQIIKDKADNEADYRAIAAQAKEEEACW